MEKVTLYALSTCPWCRKMKQFFQENKVPFECTDYDLADENERAKIRKEIAQHGSAVLFPFIKIGDHAIIGYHPEECAKLLGLTRKEGRANED